MNEITIRIACAEDAEKLLEIYAPYVLKTAITFEYKVPAVSEFKRRIECTLIKYPYLVAEIDDNIVGYAYAGEFKGRAAYDWAVETTVYVRENIHRLGIGKALYGALESALRLQGITNLNACIARPAVKDEHLTDNSYKFHMHSGYTLVGEFHKCGYKFNRWYNMVWMEKHIGAHIENQPPIKHFSDIKKQVEKLILKK